MPYEKLALHDVRDVYSWAQAALRNKVGAHVGEDLVQELVLDIWKRSQRFDPAIGDFQGYLSRFGGAMVTDAIRRVEGRTRFQFSSHTYERQRPDVVSLEAETESGRGGLDETLGVSDMDAAERRSPTLARVLGG